MTSNGRIWQWVHVRSKSVGRSPLWLSQSKQPDECFPPLTVSSVVNSVGYPVVVSDCQSSMAASMAAHPLGLQFGGTLSGGINTA